MVHARPTDAAPGTHVRAPANVLVVAGILDDALLFSGALPAVSHALASLTTEDVQVLLVAETGCVGRVWAVVGRARPRRQPCPAARHRHPLPALQVVPAAATLRFQLAQVTTPPAAGLDLSAADRHRWAPLPVVGGVVPEPPPMPLATRFSRKFR